MEQEGQFGQIVNKCDKKSYSAQIVLKIEFTHVGTALHTISQVCDRTCHRNCHLSFLDL